MAGCKHAVQLSLGHVHVGTLSNICPTICLS